MTTVLWDVKTRTREKYLKRTRKCTVPSCTTRKYPPTSSCELPTTMVRDVSVRAGTVTAAAEGGGGYPGRSGTVPCDLGAPPAAAAITTPAMPGGSWPTSPDDRRSVSHRRPTSPGMSVLHCYSFPLLHLRQHRLNLHPLPEGERKQGTKTSVSVHTGAIAHTGQSRRRSSQGRRCGAAQKARDGKRCRDALCLLF